MQDRDKKLHFIWMSSVCIHNLISWHRGGRWDYFRESADGTWWWWVGGLGGWCWVACSMWSMGSDSICLSHLTRCSGPSWTMLRVQGMFSSGFRLSGAYFEICLQPMSWLYPLDNSWAAQCSALGQTFSPLWCSSFVTNTKEQVWNPGCSVVFSKLKPFAPFHCLIVCLTCVFTLCSNCLAGKGVFFPSQPKVMHCHLVV